MDSVWYLDKESIMKVIVAGSAGFIGHNLTKELLKCGHEVIGVDDFSTGLRANISACRGLGVFKFYEESITNKNVCKYFEGVDVVFLLAALARVQLSIDNPIETNAVNVGGSINVLEAARASGVKRVVFSSSSSIYGGKAELPSKESAKPNPLSPYALQKLSGEYYMKIYSDLYDHLDTVSLRYFNVIGPHQRTGQKVAYATVIPAILDKAVNGGIFIINGSGDVSRDFSPVENVVSANILAANHPGKLNGEVFNIGCGQTTTINQVYDKICDLAGYKIPKINGPARVGDPKKSLADITKAQEVLGYKVLVGLDESLANTYAWWMGGCKT